MPSGRDSNPCSPAATLSQPAESNPPFVPDAPLPIEARFYLKLSNNCVKCELCPRGCVVQEGKRGHCRVRENRGGTLYTLVHSQVCCAHVDPVEKKPLFHYLPGTTAFSIATAGCNVSCRFCQNWEISQARPEQIPSEFVPPQRVAEIAASYGCPTIAFTYSEPIIFGEFVMDTAEAAHRAGLRSIVVSNGFIQQDALHAVYGSVDAVKIDLKSFSEAFYKRIVGARLAPVLDTLVSLRSMGKWFEIVYLMIPTLNDDPDELRSLAQWIMAHLGADVPLHFTRYHPDYLLKNLPPTPTGSLERAREIALAEGLHYVYLGNVPGHPGENTYCPQCRKLLVERAGMQVRHNLIRNGACPFCLQAIAGILQA